MQPQQYQQQGQQYPQGYGQPQPPASMPAVPQFTDPSMGESSGNPLKVRELLGRVVSFKPVRFVPGTPGVLKFGVQERDSIVIDVLVLDGPVPFEYGGSRAEDGTGGPPVYAIDQLPALIPGVIVSNSEIVRECKAVLDANPGNVIPGRIVRGTQGSKGSPPYIIAKLGGPLDTAPHLADAARTSLFAAYADLAARAANGVLPAAVLREINGGPRKPPQQGGQQNGAAPQYPPAQYPPAQPAPQVQYQAPVQPAQQAGPVPPPPPGWAPEMWAMLTPEQKAKFI